MSLGFDTCGERRDSFAIEGIAGLERSGADESGDLEAGRRGPFAQSIDLVGGESH